MNTSTKPSKHFTPLIIAVVGSLMFIFMSPTAVLVAQEAPPANFKIAFIGDQGQGPNAVAVLNLIKAEGAQAVMHSGDLDYLDNPTAWDAQINSVLGADFPYFVSIGNHDELAWRGPNGYQHYLENRFSRLGISWSGQLGVRSTFYYKGIFFVLTAPGITNGFDDGGSGLYIRDQLAADNSIWSISSWHKNMRRMQVGGKADETGWEVYEEARKGGAIIATAHEHSYSRTHLLSSMVNQTVASTSNTLNITKGNSFAFVSGLGGHSVRTQSLTGNWWASVYAATCLPGDQICQPNATHGALFGIFNVDGQPNKAIFYFKDINGRIVDSFVVVSNVETLFISGLTPSSVEAGGGSFTLTIDGAGFVNGSVVQWNNLDRTTTFISPTRLAATITAADIAAAGTSLITVTNPEPGGGVSNAAALTVTSPPPAATTNAVSSVTVSAATLGGDVNPKGSSTDTWFEWGTSPNLDTFTSTGLQSIGSGGSSVSVSSNLAGLAANTTYYFRVAASNAGGTSKGSILSFSTSNPSLTGLQYYPLPHSVRLLDTRPGAPACYTPGAPLTANASRTQPAVGTCAGLSIPATAKAIVGNATVVSPPAAGHIILYPSGAAQPVVSNLNYVAGQIVPNAFTVGLSAAGAFNIYTPTATHFIIDVAGYYAPPGEGGLYYHPLPHPVRLLDTRPGQTACDAPGAPLQANAARTETARTTCAGVIIPNDAQAVVGNATVVSPPADGHIILYPSGAAQPVVSNLNYLAGQIIPNAFTVTVGGDGAVKIYSPVQTHFIVDVTGYFSASAAPDANGVAGLLFYPLAAPARLLDTRPGQTACYTPGAPLQANSVRTQAARGACAGSTVPASAQAILGNATVVTPTAAGHIILYPSGAQQPVVSNLNYLAGQIIPNAFNVTVGGDGAFQIYTPAQTHFIIDMAGYFAP